MDYWVAGRELSRRSDELPRALGLLFPVPIRVHSRSFAVSPLSPCVVSPGEWEPPLLIGESEVEIPALAVA